MLLRKGSSASARSTRWVIPASADPGRSLRLRAPRCKRPRHEEQRHDPTDPHFISASAQAAATSRLGSPVLPGIVAQPPLLT